LFSLIGVRTFKGKKGNVSDLATLTFNFSLERFCLLK